METKVKENGAAVNNGKPVAKEASFINGNPVNKEAVKPEKAKAGEVKNDGAPGQSHQVQPLKPENGQPKADPLAADNPALFQQELDEFLENYNPQQLNTTNH